VHIEAEFDPIPRQFEVHCSIRSLGSAHLWLGLDQVPYKGGVFTVVVYSRRMPAPAMTLFQIPVSPAMWA
jgi:hypothetical protein